MADASYENCQANIGPAALVSAWIEAALATIVVAIRFGTQIWIVKRLGWDDWIMLSSLMVAMLNTSLITHAITWGLGHHFHCLDARHQVNSMKWEYVAQPAGAFAPALARIAFCLYLLKFIGFNKWKKWFLWSAIITQVVVNVLVVVQILVQCQHMESLWNPAVQGRCWDPRVQAYLGFFQGAWNSLTDLALTLLPILILKNLNMKLSTRIALGIIMGMSIFAMVAAIVKTIQIRTLLQRKDFTWDTVIFVIWFSIENYIVIVSASVPTIRPLILWLWRRPNHHRSSQASHSKSDQSNSNSKSPRSGQPPKQPSACAAQSSHRGGRGPPRRFSLVRRKTQDNKHVSKRMSLMDKIRKTTQISVSSVRQKSPMRQEYDPGSDFPFHGGGGGSGGGVDGNDSFV